MSIMLLARPSFGRTGLANKLFPWARCVAFSSVQGIRMIAPRWSQLPVGPLLRGERDPRLYLGLFEPLADELRGPRARALEVLLPRVDEPPSPDAAAGRRHGLVEFEGLGTFFEPLSGFRQLLGGRLRRMCRPHVRRALTEAPSAPIGIHVRRGDFQLGAHLTPLDWYIATLRQLRGVVGWTVPVIVVSDGDDHELAALCGEPEVALVRAGTAVGDMLALARCRVVLGSQGSTFSAWASFLSQAPVAVMPGSSYADDFGLAHENGAFVGTHDPDGSDDAFLRAVARSGLIADP